jgi:hypothetical protein
MSETESVPATLYHRNYIVDPIHASCQTVREIYIPSVKATINYSDDQLNVCLCETLPKENTSMFMLNQSEPICDHTEIKLSKDFVDLVKEMLQKQTEIQQIESNLLDMGESLFLGVEKSE